MSFENIVGHERPIQILKTTLRRNSLAHAYLFYGDEGIGKKLVAKAFAQAVNCSAQPPEDRRVDDSCGKCISCLHIQSEIHPDFIAIEPEGATIKVGQIRTIQEQIQLQPIAGRYRVVIVNEAETMNEEATNALLKSLEEPPISTILILITSKPYAILPTVVSRCQKIRFTPLTNQQIMMLLKQKTSFNTSQLGQIAALAMGKIGLALELDPNTLEAELLKFNQILLGHSPGRTEALLNLAQEYAGDRETTQRALQWIGLWLRDVLITKIQQRASSVVIGSPSPEFMKAAAILEIEEIMACVNLVHWIWKALARNINRQLALEVLLMRIQSATKRAR
jgi:DNA polymerase-3 subunit delta'